MDDIGVIVEECHTLKARRFMVGSRCFSDTGGVA